MAIILDRRPRAPGAIVSGAPGAKVNAAEAGDGRRLTDSFGTSWAWTTDPTGKFLGFGRQADP
jgi:hypothetical protein